AAQLAAAADVRVLGGVQQQPLDLAGEADRAGECGQHEAGLVIRSEACDLEGHVLSMDYFGLVWNNYPPGGGSVARLQGWGVGCAASGGAIARTMASCLHPS